MKKLFAILAALLLVVTLTSCDKSKQVEEAYEKEEYTVTDTTVEDTYSTPLIGSIIKGLIESNYTEEQQEEMAKYSLIFAYNGTNFALILKFPNASDVKSFLTTEDDEGNKDTSSYDDAKSNGQINGNLLVLVSTDAALAIFK